MRTIATVHCAHVQYKAWEQFWWLSIILVEYISEAILHSIVWRTTENLWLLKQMRTGFFFCFSTSYFSLSLSLTRSQCICVFLFFVACCFFPSMVLIKRTSHILWLGAMNRAMVKVSTFSFSINHNSESGGYSRCQKTTKKPKWILMIYWQFLSSGFVN